MSLEIRPLCDHPQLLPQLARWHHSEWRKYSPSSSLDKRLRRLQRHLNDDPIPQTFVALDQGQLLGSASLVCYQFGPKVVLEPWLSNVFVVENARREGVGNALVAHAEAYAARQGFTVMKLFTADKKAFYLRRGWIEERKARMSGYEVDILSLSLEPGDEEQD